MPSEEQTVESRVLLSWRHNIRFGTWPCQVLTHLLGVPLWCEREGRTAQNRPKISSKPDPRAIFCSVTAQYKRGGKPAIQNRLCWEVESYMATVVFVVSVSKRGCRGTLFFWPCLPIKQNLKRSSHDVVEIFYKQKKYNNTCDNV